MWPVLPAVGAFPPRIIVVAVLSAAIPAPISRISCIFAVVPAAVPLCAVPVLRLLAVLPAAIPSRVPVRPWHAGLPKSEAEGEEATTLSGKLARINEHLVVD